MRFYCQHWDCFDSRFSIPSPKSQSQSLDNLKRNLDAHIQNMHIVQQNLRCPQCNKSFKNLKRLKKHNKTVHLEPEKFKCTHCGKGFATNNNRRTHELFHSKTKNFPCSLCDQSFYTDSSRKSHCSAIHLKEKVKCQKCDFEGRFDKIKYHVQRKHSQ